MSRVGLFFGGRTVEHRVSVASARTIARGLLEAGHTVAPLGVGPDGGLLAPEVAQRALDGELAQLPPGGHPIKATLSPLLEADVEVCFPTIHGTWGEDGSLQGLCEMLDLPYVGAGVAASAVAMDKALCKGLLSSRGLPVVDGEVVTALELRRSPEAALARLSRLKPPVFIKPAVGGSSVGVSRVDRPEALEKALLEATSFDSRLLVERAVSGRELECGVLGYQQLEASAIGEVVPGKDFYDYADKYIDDGAQLIAPAELPEAVAHQLRALAVEAFSAIGGEGMARVDFFLEGEGALSINEINTLPGFTDISMYPRLWGLSGLPLARLVDRLVEIALERHRDRRQLDSGIKAWIESL